MKASTSCQIASCSPLDQIRELYTELALNPHQDFGWAKGKDNARRLGYRAEWLNALPDVVWESAAAVGNPFSTNLIRPGDTVVDLGCGAGADACIAALLVGNTGRVVGIDLTPAMVAKARENAIAAGLPNVQFREGPMDGLEFPDLATDVVISNGAVNLAEDKAKVFAEVFRILRHGGRFGFADMVREPCQTSCCSAGDTWADCVSGTIGVDEVLQHLSDAGFSDVEHLATTGYKTAASTVGAIFRARKR